MIFFATLSLLLCIMCDALKVHQFSEEFLNKSILELEMRELLGIGQSAKRLRRQLPLKNSAAKFLFEVYNIVEEHESENVQQSSLWSSSKRSKRSTRGSNFLTELDVMEISKCNTIITFPSKPFSTTTNGDFNVVFATNRVSSDLNLVHSFLRIYQQPNDDKLTQYPSKQLATVFVYQEPLNQTFKILTSTNTTIAYKGWLEFDITETLNKWLKRKSEHYLDLKIAVNIVRDNKTEDRLKISAHDLGLIMPYSEEEETFDFQPFIIAYFNGPELLQKIQKLRTKRNISLKRNNAFALPSNWKSAMCKRHDFVIDFEDLNMGEWIIAPKRYEAYFCAGECSFPLNMQTDATNHAIVQNLMNIKRPSLPKPCCTPVTLSSIKILHYDINENAVLTKFANSIVKGCGCN
uniref:TGF-beta family profile domain-containing protein n=1 Tax=Glossina palpalis gambiensis TaxID=67801 RepID=A0A1B0ANV6_9MUSC